MNNVHSPGPKGSSLYGVFDCMRWRGQLTKKELQRHTGFSWGSISNYTARLLADGVIKEYADLNGTGKGRPPSSFGVNRRKNWILGMDVQMNRLCGAVVALDGSRICDSVLELKSREATDVFTKILNLLERLFNSVKSPGEIRRIGFSMPGLINPVPGKPLGVHHFSGFFPAHMLGLIEERFGVPAVIFHDTDCVLMAHVNNMPPEEYERMIRSNVLLVRWSYGIGSAMLLNGNLYFGDHRAAGEMGHTVVDPEGPLCLCGNRGCLEVYASFRKVLEEVQACRGELSAGAIWVAYRERDKNVVAIVDRVADYMASALISAVKLLDPRLVIIEGEFAAAPKECLDRLRAKVFSRLNDDPKVEIQVRHWEDSGAFGAAEMLMKDVFCQIVNGQAEHIDQENQDVYMENDEPWSIEMVNPEAPRGDFKFAIFDFDGTISLIREGWQQIMIPYFTDELAACPGSGHTPREALEEEARDFIYVNTGKQTIYQCIELSERVAKRGGKALEPLEYKAEYHRRLEKRIADRIAELQKNPGAAPKHAVPGSFNILNALKKRGVIMYLASGTDEVYVKQEAALLHVTPYFAGVYGAQDDYKHFSKKIVIDRIIAENNLHGKELLGFGDGYVEIENVKGVGGFACGVATDETRRYGVDQWKRNRLKSSGADIIIPDFTEIQKLEDFLFPGTK
ncbi:hypothetical protein FACS1894161_2260 [Spirochaetia bacterium]|nr:hypothetical protein FACS1894161_2260 [Spirochaetia bacterium]